jgi:hypothetical protein
MYVHLCIFASLRILRYDPGDKPISSDGGVTYLPSIIALSRVGSPIEILPLFLNF